jgi:hypothetical protein
VQKDPTALSTTYQKTPRTTTQPQVVNVYHDDNHEPIQPFDEVVFVRQPWQFATLGYNLPKTNASTGFQNQPPHTNINLVPLI